MKESLIKRAEEYLEKNELWGLIHNDEAWIMKNTIPKLMADFHLSQTGEEQPKNSEAYKKAYDECPPEIRKKVIADLNKIANEQPAPEVEMSPMEFLESEGRREADYADSNMLAHIAFNCKRYSDYILKRQKQYVEKEKRELVEAGNAMADRLKHIEKLYDCKSEDVAKWEELLNRNQ